MLKENIKLRCLTGEGDNKYNEFLLSSIVGPLLGHV
jgi:hypothetical protein